ncbi:MAG: four helix bundle protein [bacterium]|nr:four helix bundle protein [bacterium]
MATFKKFEEVDIWKKSRELTKRIYEASRKGLFAKDYALGDQIRRASVSIMSNIAEGFNRGGNKELVQYLAIAKGSAAEIQSQLYVALDQQYISKEEFNDLYDLTDQIAAGIFSFIVYLNKSNIKGIKFKSVQIPNGK